MAELEFISEAEIKDLIKNRTELGYVDLKGPMKFGKKGQPKEHYGLVKDILAMSNRKGGGLLIIGVANNGDVLGMDEAQVESFDVSKVSQAVEQHADPPVSLQVYRPRVEDKNLVIIRVLEFAEEPTICKKQEEDSEAKLVLRVGAIYFRDDGARTEQINHAQMRKLLGNALIKKRDMLLGEISAILRGDGVEKSGSNEIELKQEIEKISSELLGELNVGNKGYYRFVCYPKDFNQVRIEDYSQMTEVIRDSKVLMRAISSPTLTPPDKIINLTSGIRCTIKEGPYRLEGWQLNKSGLFVWIGTFSEDHERFVALPANSISPMAVIGYLIEFVKFAKELCTHFEITDQVLLRADLFKTKERFLVSDELMLRGSYKCHESEIMTKKSTSVAELQSSWKEVARDLSKKVLSLFNFMDINNLFNIKSGKMISGIK